VIDDEVLVDALDDFRQAATPAVLAWVARMALAAKHYAQRGGSAEDVAGFDALERLALVVAESGR
jgi:hypothetical protein